MATILLHDVYPEMCKTWEVKFRDIIMADVPTEPVSTDHRPLIKLPICLNTLDDWPLTTNIHCWHCTLQFNTRPWYIPGSTLLDPRGNFCGLPCIAGWLQTHPEWNTSDTRKQINALSIAFVGKAPRKLIEGLSHTQLEMYGGELTNCELVDELQRCTARMLG